MEKMPVVIDYLKRAAVFDYAKIEEYCSVPAALIIDAVNGNNKLDEIQVRRLEWFLGMLGIDFRIVEKLDGGKNT
ncbi:hypothetical protein [Flavihumibacter sp. ZG627]|uniref:hypothetical protein n=1 Tax=Flavihumibacter sp. ZG627 TaxID=1463156 RepID=UPI00057F3BCF|nr:hypothetical protein [Flavihumibacter sp. ZG627]KIC89407.1 hypothetical protein HY58_16175 [Flavihumibacter sp. ZG627]